MQVQLTAYSLLFLSIIWSWQKRDLSASIAIALSLSVAFFSQILDTTGLSFLFVFTGLTWIANLKLQKFVWLYRICFFASLILAIGLFTHVVPGFKNLLIFDRIHFSEKSSPFTMYLNYDKIFAGLILFHFYVRSHSSNIFSARDLKILFKTFALLVLCILPLGLASGYIAVDMKWPAQILIWSLNNFFFVCFAEEALFRGLLQDKISKLSIAQWPMQKVAIAVSAILFGLAHFKGGFSYVALATFAGCFYGYAFFRTRALLSSMLIHFSLNALHFVFFTYPAFAR